MGCEFDLKYLKTPPWVTCLGAAYEFEEINNREWCENKIKHKENNYDNFDFYKPYEFDNRPNSSLVK